ncbi:hypothetical protein JX266_005096 [Neoarthrinium moseri]|uniref:uncharacterized protein n=1 Tax=Neoarthrinium moseri TaxID=1658444 RepID=UPI001FDAFF02|nr:uncharacterized protein JN550_006431 [Neoarthrinium moseri]KAI1849135.1 hypothetical protein JX266_005096 [Neoarthrinium moseri]KAI1868515.1 hypothetical protein JN550_006431 [Neoarthrinium moseri]
MTRTAELESKIDGPISQLQLRNVIESDATPRQNPMLPESAGASSYPPSDAGEDEIPDKDESEMKNEDNGEIQEHTRKSNSPELRVSEVEAETFLTTFRACMLPHFPFVDLPAPMTALTTMIDDPGWDRAAVGAIIDVPMLLGRIDDKLELVSRTVAEEDSDGIFTELAQMMREFYSDLAGSTAHEIGEVGPELPGAPANDIGTYCD